MSSYFSHSDFDFKDSVIESLNELHQKTNLILRYLNIFYEKEQIMSVDLSAIVAAVKNEKTVEQSLISLVSGLSQKVAALAAVTNDDSIKAQLAELANEINSNAADMASAVQANTPVTTGQNPEDPVVAPVVTPSSDAAASTVGTVTRPTTVTVDSTPAVTPPASIPAQADAVSTTPETPTAR